jgi:hypothetical protein
LEDFLESRLRVKYGEALADVSKETTYATPGGRPQPAPFAEVEVSQKFVSEITFSNLRFLYL